MLNSVLHMDERIYLILLWQILYKLTLIYLLAGNLGHFFRESTTTRKKVSWVEADSWCTSRNYSLPSFNSLQEIENFLNSIESQYTAKTTLGTCYYRSNPIVAVYIGLHIEVIVQIFLDPGFFKCIDFLTKGKVKQWYDSTHLLGTLSCNAW